MADILFGRNSILEALRAGRTVTRLVHAPGLVTDQRLEEIFERARAGSAVIEVRSRAVLSDMAHTEHHQGVVAYCHRRELLSLPELLDIAPAPAALLVLDGIQDPHNVGALARTSHAAGFGGIIFSRERSVGVTPTVVRTSAGVVEHMDLATVTNMARTLTTLQENGIWTIGLAGEGDLAPDEVDMTVPVAIVVGSEGKGLSQLVRKHCDVVVRIPMHNDVESLNASVAGSIVMYEVERQRRARTG